MGKAAVEALARKGRSVTMACRNLEKGEAALSLPQLLTAPLRGY